MGLGLSFVAIWSSAFTRRALSSPTGRRSWCFPPRFLVSGLIALGIGWALGQRIRLSRREWHAVIVFGVCQNALYLGLFHEAMRTVDASLAAIIASAMPLCVAALARAFFGAAAGPARGSRAGRGLRRRARHHAARVAHGLDLRGVGLCVVGRARARDRDADAAQRLGERQPLDRRRAANAGREPWRSCRSPGARDLERALVMVVRARLRLFGADLRRGGDDDLVRAGAADRRHPRRRRSTSSTRSSASPPPRWSSASG